MTRNHMKQLVLKKQIFCDDGMRSDEITERRQCNCPSKTQWSIKSYGSRN